METLMGRAWEATPKKECRYWPGRRISKKSSGIKINYIKACQLHRRKDAGRCDESVKKKEERRRNQRTRLTEDDTPFLLWWDVAWMCVFVFNLDVV